MGEPIIQVHAVVRTFAAGKTRIRALDGVDLDVEPGIVYGLLGPNGAGKTTLIRVLATLLRPDTGSAFVAGVDVVRDPAKARRAIGLAGQFAAVDDHLTGRENVELIGRLYGLSRRDTRVRAGNVLEGIGLGDAADRRVKTYSGGMRRRIDLAASLVGRPQVLFLDEPTTGIDPASRRDLWDLIRDLVRTGTTVLLTTQYLEEADQLAARIGVIDHGRLISEGTSDELKSRVGGQVLELTVREPDIAAASSALRDMAGDQTVSGQPGGRLVIPAPEGPRTVQQALHRLDAAGIAPEAIALHKATLDDVFLALTGRTTGKDVNNPDHANDADARTRSAAA